MSQYQGGVVHLVNQLTEQQDDMLTNQGETTFWMKIKLPFPVVRADLSVSLLVEPDICETRYHLQIDDARPRKQAKERSWGCLLCCLKLLHKIIFKCKLQLLEAWKCRIQHQIESIHSSPSLI